MGSLGARREREEEGGGGGAVVEVRVVKGVRGEGRGRCEGVSVVAPGKWVAGVPAAPAPAPLPPPPAAAAPGAMRIGVV